MERKIRTRRVYSLAPYNTFETEDEVSDIPDNLMFDNNYIKKIKFLQLVELELQYYRYVELVKELDAMPTDDRIKYLKDLKSNISKDLNEYLFTNTPKKEE